MNTFHHLGSDTELRMKLNPGKKQDLGVVATKNIAEANHLEKSSRHCSMVSTVACYRGGPGFKSRQWREFINF